ncbi:hypothetical protein [Lapidilactobacillus concavus]|uniref:hypothetical protein n=1 Tax=Lapidilactobacillus concavus TaxID=287844 RepID=UPI001F25997C|nr:hypothetical protein [Lapidilactobacillus concavus]
MASLILNGVGDRHCIYDFGTLFDHAIAGIVGYIKIVSSRERRKRMTGLTNSLMSDPLRTIGIILAALGVLIFPSGVNGLSSAGFSEIVVCSHNYSGDWSSLPSVQCSCILR